jgi:hypothetical protein
MNTARATGRVASGAGVRSPDPYPLGRFFEAPNQNLVAGQSGGAECDSAWSGERAPAPDATRPLHVKSPG